MISGGNNPTATSKAQCGSIIHGTPVSSPNIYSQNRYESSSSLIHQVPTPHKESGSITQGIVLALNLMFDLKFSLFIYLYIIY